MIQKFVTMQKNDSEGFVLSDDPQTHDSENRALLHV